MFQLLEVSVTAETDAWRDAGFAIDSASGLDSCRIGSTTFFIGAGAGVEDPPGISTMAIAGLDPGRLDGIALVTPIGARSSGASMAHPNGVSGVDHLVVQSPDVDRTTDVLIDAGLELRRERRFPAGDATMRQSFFWLGDVILELVGDDSAHGPGPATAWGLAFTATDLDHVAAVAGDAATAPKRAVQPGRRIMAIHGLGLPVAIMTPHQKR